MLLLCSLGYFNTILHQPRHYFDYGIEVKGVVDCFFSRLDCVYGVQSNVLMLRLKKKNNSHNLPLFYTVLSLLL